MYGCILPVKFVLCILDTKNTFVNVSNKLSENIWQYQIRLPQNLKHSFGIFLTSSLTSHHITNHCCFLLSTVIL